MLIGGAWTSSLREVEFAVEWNNVHLYKHKVLSYGIFCYTVQGGSNF